jgi:exosortase/archaeosortase family protein
MTGQSEAPSSAKGFALRAGAWIVGLVALLRLPWVTNHLLVPFASLQQRAAEGLSGTSGAVVVDASCTGSDAMALTFGAILAFPSTWRKRLLGCLTGLGLLTAVNTVRIGTLGAVVKNRPLFDLLHVHLWPAALIVVAAGFVFLWMRRQTAAVNGPSASTERPATSNRFLLYTVAAVGAYFLAAPLLSKSAWLLEVAGWCAATTGAVARSLGLEAQIQGNYFFAASGRWIVTQDCILTPLIALYLAGVAAAPISRGGRLLAALATAPLFFGLGVARLLVLTLPTTLVPEPGIAMHAFYQVVAGISLIGALAWSRRNGAGASAAHGARALGVALGATLAGAALSALAGALVSATSSRLPGLAHLGHGYVDGQGALLVLPALMTGTWAGLWWALDRPSSWNGLFRGWLLLMAVAGLGILALGEAQAHFGVELPIVVIRALALAAPALLSWWAARPRQPTGIPVAPGPSTAIS